MVAVDGGFPALSSTATVDITVTRNLNTPVFEDDIKTVIIPDNSLPGNHIFTATATDADREVIHNQEKIYKIMLPLEQTHVFSRCYFILIIKYYNILL